MERDDPWSMNNGFINCAENGGVSEIGLLLLKFRRSAPKWIPLLIGATARAEPWPSQWWFSAVADSSCCFLPSSANAQQFRALHRLLQPSFPGLSSRSGASFFFLEDFPGMKSVMLHPHQVTGPTQGVPLTSVERVPGSCNSCYLCPLPDLLFPCCPQSRDDSQVSTSFALG